MTATPFESLSAVTERHSIRILMSQGADLGDIGFDAAIGKSFPSGMQLIGGMVVTVPPATDDDLGLDQWLLGPEAFVGWKFQRGFLGALVSH